MKPVVPGPLVIRRRHIARTIPLPLVLAILLSACGSGERQGTSTRPPASPPNPSSPSPDSVRTAMDAAVAVHRKLVLLVESEDARRAYERCLVLAPKAKGAAAIRERLDGVR